MSKAGKKSGTASARPCGCRGRSPALALAAPGIAALVAGVLAADLLPGRALAASRTTAEDLAAGRLNPTGRVIALPVPFREEGGGVLGEVVAKLNADDSVEVPKAAVLAAIADVVTPQTVALVEALPDAGGHVRLAAFASAGLDVRFDPGALELVIAPTVDQRPAGAVDFSRRRIPTSANLERPALWSGYLNLSAGADYLWDVERGEDGLTGPRFDVEAVTRLGGVVLESEFTYEGEDDSDICPPGSICTGGHFQGFKRRGTRLVYDMTDEMLRFQAGDTTTFVTRFQRSVDVLGLSVEKSPAKLRPGENIQPTGSSSFRIERPSEVDVLINGAVVRQLRLRPGNYDLSDLPLRTGANEVELVITDDTGESRTLAFKTFFDAQLLAPGISVWSLSAGLPSYYRDNEVTYRDGEIFASGYYRLGLTDEVTGEIHAQGDEDTVMGGLGLLMQTGFGFFGLHGAVSNSDIGTGVAVDVNWDLANVTGITGNRETLRVSAEYRSEEFRAPGEFVETAGGIIAPTHDYWLRLAASYTMPLDHGITASLSGRYQFVDDERAVTPGRRTGDRYGAELTLSAPVTRSLQGSVLVGWSNEAYSHDGLPEEQDSEVRAAVRFSWRPEGTTSTRVSASYDTLNERSNLSASSTFGRGVGSWDTSVDVQHDQGDERASVGGAVGYRGNRFEARLAHTTAFDGVGYDDFDVTPSDQRTTLRVGTSIAFADGVVGKGAPIRSQAFALVSPHETIADRRVIIGAHDDVIAIADGLGPAVVPSVPAYTSTSLPYDVDDLPLGYSLGTSVFDLKAPYRGGYSLEVGSSYSVSAYGTLIGRDGEPIALLTGIARSEAAPGREVTIFTNRSGKFGADGLAPGRWVIEMATEGAPTRFVLDIPEGTDGLHRAGTLEPSG
ncbi:MAG: fimbria/pilus outer membrane usher protein [Rhizobiales bacterium]|nr:fimbria/pilus outer membrane usher protein [Hyphomicrobiales bacterium]